MLDSNPFDDMVIATRDRAGRGDVTLLTGVAAFLATQLCAVAGFAYPLLVARFRDRVELVLWYGGLWERLALPSSFLAVNALLIAFLWARSRSVARRGQSSSRSKGAAFVVAALLVAFVQVAVTQLGKLSEFRLGARVLYDSRDR